VGIAGIEIVNAVTGENYTLYHGDCLAVMPALAAQSVDATITDLPYGTTACAWDEIIPFEPMWEQVKRLLKPRGAFVTTSSQPFTSKLVMSNLDWFRYTWVWEKSNATRHLDCHRMPMRRHEDIAVFAQVGPNYYPQIADRPKANIRPDTGGNGTSVYNTFRKAGGLRRIPIDKTYPQTVLRFNSVNSLKRIHDTQKPLPLYEYLIRTYTNPDDVVLDICMGSGTTGVAAMRTGRRFIGIELDAGYFQIAAERIANAAGDLTTTARERASGQLSLLDYGNDNE